MPKRASRSRLLSMRIAVLGFAALYIGR